jgi:hypothetical protein
MHWNIFFTKSEVLNRLQPTAAALLDPILRSIYAALLPNFPFGEAVVLQWIRGNP